MKRLAYFVALQIFSFMIFAFDLVTHDALTFFPKPLDTLPNGINGITWSDKDYFAISEANYVCFALNESLASQLIQSPGGNIRFIKFVKNPETQNDHLLVVTENNVIGVKIFSDVESNEFSTKTFDSELRINSVDFSPDGSKVLMGAENGEVHMMLQLQVSQEISDLIIYEHKKGVSSVAFSPDYKYFLSAGKEGEINIWSAEKENKKLFTIEQKKRFPVPVKFSADSLYVVSAKAMNKLIFTDFAGNVVQEIKVKGKILDYSFSSDSDYIFILNTYNNICIYDVKSGEYVGYIPPFNKTPIARFAFNKKENRLLVGHDDGTVFYLKSDEVVLKPGAKAPNLGKGGVGVIGTKVVEVNAKTDPKRIVPTINNRSPHSVEIRAAALLQPKPYYSLGGEISIGYINSDLISPFYFGVLVAPAISFPRKDFPYQYYNNNGEQVAPPYFLVGNISVPIGISVMPFKNDWEFFGELQPGFAIHALYSKDYFPKHLLYSASIGFYVGAVYKGFTIFCGGDYDVGFGMSCTAGMGYRIKIGKV